MSNQENEQLRLEELLSLTKTTKEVSDKLMDKGRNLVEAGQSARELAIAFEGVATSSPDGFFNEKFVTSIASGFKEFNSVANSQIQAVALDKKLVQLAQGNLSSVAITTSAAASLSGAGLPREWKAITELLHRTTDVGAVKRQMSDFGLAVPRGDICSSLQLFEAAEGALKRPFSDEGYATAVLVPLRESVQRAVDELLKRRAHVEKTGGWETKVVSIGQQLRKTEVSDDQLARIAASTHTLIDHLSAAKDHQMSREEISDLFDQGVSLLQSIFAMIDVEKLR